MVNSTHFSAFKIMISIYIHIPFCIKKCDYCAFYSISSSEDTYEEYTKAILLQINSFPRKEYVKTIYFGGGTPSIIGAKRLNKILDQIKYKFDISTCDEITLEVNPKTTSLQDLTSLKNNGFNRLSIGLQSTNNKLLEEIGRQHNFEDFLKTYENSKIAGFSNISVDLMYGLPFQNINDHIESLAKVVDLDIQHISVYGLTLEPGTKIFKFRDSYSFPDEDEELEMYLATSQFLQKNGFNHYEISNFAKKSYESKHNTGYWTGRNYIGFGTSAHSFYDLKRFSCNYDVNSFIYNSKILNDFFLYTDYHNQSKLNDEDLKEEKIMLMLRLKDGVELNSKQALKAKTYINAGYMKYNNYNNKYSFTSAGWYVSNSIITNLLSE